MSDELVLRRCLERAAPELFSGRSAIAKLERSRFELNTSYDTYLVHLGLASGDELRLFLKDFSVSLRAKNDRKQRREREVHVYEELLRDAGLGTARYYGSVMDEAQGRLWLLLEYVDGTPVGYCELGDGWAPAAFGLGRMHGYFARSLDLLRGRPFLIEHRPEFFWSAAEQARTNVEQVAPDLVGRVENLVRGYAPIVRLMTGQPPTLVQGGCRSSNILIRVAGDPSRVCILDWEEASFGAPLFDVAHLLDGIESPLLDRLLEAYRRGAAEYEMPLPPLDEMKYAVECFRLHMAFNSLSRAVLKGYERADILKLLDYGESIGRVVYGRLPGPPASASSLEEDRLRPMLERFISKVQRRDVEVSGWKREPSPVAVAGVFPVEVMRVSLRGGQEVALFVKHLGSEQADHPDKQCRDREPRIYEELFHVDGLPVPEYYGSRWNEGTKRRELYLEYVGDWSLRYQGLESWFAAAPELARFHAAFARRAAELRECDYLLRLDAPYFQAWAERALAAVTQQGPAGLIKDLRRVVTGYGRVPELLARQPVTLVHNDLAPKNVLADRSHDPTRICFVDWEMAGVGCGLLDLVHLNHGLDPKSDQAMCRAYCAELAGSGLLPSSASELGRLFAACDLHQTLYRLAHGNAWGVPSDRLAQWVVEARYFAGQV